MKILGIDPGMAIVGYAMININNDDIELITSGSIQTDKNLDDSKRLLEIYNDLSLIIEKYQPDCASVEQLFFFKNQKTIIPVAEARGVILTVLEKYLIFTDATHTETRGASFSGFISSTRNSTCHQIPSDCFPTPTSVAETILTSLDKLYFLIYSKALSANSRLNLS